MIGAASNMSLLGSSMAVLLIDRSSPLYRVANFRAELYLVLAAMYNWIYLGRPCCCPSSGWPMPEFLSGQQPGTLLAGHVMWALFATTINALHGLDEGPLAVGRGDGGGIWAHGLRRWRKVGRGRISR